MEYKVNFRVIGDKPPFTVTLHEDDITNPAVLTKTVTTSNIIQSFVDGDGYIISPFKKYCVKAVDFINNNVSICDVDYPQFNLSVLPNQSVINVKYLNIDENIFNNKSYNIPQLENVLLTATPPQGYTFKNWETIPNTILNNSTDNPLNFSMLNTNFSIKPINEDNSNAFIFTIDTTKGSNFNFTLPLKEGFNYDFVVDWGDGNTNTITSWDDIEKTHEYTTGGLFQVSITGLCESINFMHGSTSKLISVDQWGDVGFINMSQAFFSCSNLTSIYDNNGDWTTNVTNMSAMFYGCGKLTNLDVSNWDVSNVTNMNGMFNNCASLTTLDVSNWDVGNVGDMSGMFYDCVELNVLGLENWNISNVTNMINILHNVTLETPYYDSIIINWASLTPQNNVVFDANLCRRSSISCDAYNTLVDTYNWNISDNSDAILCITSLEITYDGVTNKVLYSVIIPYEGVNANIEITPSGGGTTQIIPITIENYRSYGEHTITLNPGSYDVSVVADRVYIQRPLTVY